MLAGMCVTGLPTPLVSLCVSCLLVLDDIFYPSLPLVLLFRVIRSKLDYGLMIFADSRYNRHDKRTKLPKWILDCMGTNHLDLSTGDAMEKGK